jgi:hypothetical protein
MLAFALGLGGKVILCKCHSLSLLFKCDEIEYAFLNYLFREKFSIFVAAATKIYAFRKNIKTNLYMNFFLAKKKNKLNHSALLTHACVCASHSDRSQKYIFFVFFRRVYENTSRSLAQRHWCFKNKL